MINEYKFVLLNFRGVHFSATLKCSKSKQPLCHCHLSNRCSKPNLQLWARFLGVAPNPFVRRIDIQPQTSKGFLQ